MARSRTTKGTTDRGRTGGRASARRTAPPAGPSARELTADIIGIALTVAAVALLIAVLMPGDAPLPAAVSGILAVTLGIGRFVLPIALFAWALSFFFEQLELDELTVGGGLALAFASIVSILALATPLGKSYWSPATLASHGGYAGAGIAWALRSLMGDPITWVVLVGLFSIGLVLATGVKVATVVESVRSLFASDEEEDDGLPRPRRAMRAGGKTVPLRDLDDEGDGLEAAPAVADRRRQDPEAQRRTVPNVKAVAPKRMDGYVLPPPSLLKMSPANAAATRATDKELRATAQLIEQTLATFDIPSRVEAWIPGPTVTLFEVKIAKGVKVNRVTGLADDLALALAAPTVRVLAPIPGKSLIGIEVPNVSRSTVTLGDVIVGAPISESSPLMLGIGKDISGERIILDLAGMPHMLIAGSTGTGKSVCINSLLMTLLVRTTPAEVRLILIDPKRIELSLYNYVPHLYVPVVTEAKEAASALAWAVSEMESRLRRLQAAQARNIAGYNALVNSGKGPEGAEPMPYIVIVIDELADLMMVAAREVEDSICRLAQLARAAGIHLVVATQRPSTDIITGLIKTNITHRIAFMVGSQIDSRVILDQPGAEKLVGLGDMLLSTPALAKPKRVQGALVTEDEINAVVAHLRTQAEPDYHEEILHMKVAATGGGVDTGEDDDPLTWEAADIVVMSRMGSTSLLQRRLKVGYARAGRIMDILEQKGVVGPPDGSKPRDVLVDVPDLEQLKALERMDQRERDEE